MEIKWKKVKKNGKLHTPKCQGDAGADLSVCLSDEEIPSHGGKGLVSTGVAVEIPEGYVGLVLGRSSTLKRYGLTVQTGVIDSGYRDEIKVQVQNNSKKDFFVTKQMEQEGVRLAQLVIVPFIPIEAKEVESLDERTHRGRNGFGSTGK